MKIINNSEQKDLSDPNICVCIMVKNESDGILLSLDSVKDIASSIVILDTGSEDDTIKVITDWCNDNSITLYLKEEAFVDFSVSRNVLLDFADNIKECEFQLLMDSRGELQGCTEFMEFIKSVRQNGDSGAYSIRQKWYNGPNSTYVYFNRRLIKPRHGWRYKQPVHEYMYNIKGDIKSNMAFKQCNTPNVCLYQERTKDGGNSEKRYIRDKGILQDVYNKNPTDSRIVFYLAQTYQCLKDYELAYKYYIERTKLKGYQEEVFHAYLRAGDIGVVLEKPWEHAMGLYLKSFECLDTKRVEPLLNIARHYITTKQWKLAHMFIKEACLLEYPTELKLFVDPTKYTYARWHMLGIISDYCGDGEDYLTDGYIGALNAYNQGSNKGVDKHNMCCYERKLGKEKIKEIIDRFS